MHPLSPVHRYAVGFRLGDAEMALGGRGRLRPGRLCRLGIRGVVEGEVLSVPLTPDELLSDQERALASMVETVGLASPTPAAVGLGSLLAVVAGRGEGLAEAVSVPVTTGAAATTWAALGNTLEVCRQLGERRVAVLGFGATVGEALAELLGRQGLEVLAGGHGKALERRATKLGVKLLPEDEAARSARVVVGAATTGGTLDPGVLRPGTVMLDVALPPTLRPGPLPAGVRVLAAEAVALPPRWMRGFWGRFYHVLAGYGPRQLFACLAEPMLMAVSGRREPFALGRRVAPEAVEQLGREAAALGLRPRLAEGWRAAKLSG